MLDRTLNDIFDIIGDCDICLNLKAPMIAFVLPDELVCTVICPVSFLSLILHICAPESVTACTLILDLLIKAVFISTLKDDI